MTTVGKIIVAVLGIHLFVLLVVVVNGSCSRNRGEEPPAPSESAPAEPEKPAPPVYQVRPFPEKFPRRSCMPDKKESEASGAISNSAFSPGRDLVYVDDPRVWWESDFDGETDDEDDHSMHRAMEPAFRRLVELDAMSNATLRVQEAYRPSTIHSTLSLHKEGRALDLTFERIEGEKLTPFEKVAVYESLAKLCWQAGFDWVYYEQARGTGPHVHASVRRLPSQPPVPPPPPDAKR